MRYQELTLDDPIWGEAMVMASRSMGLVLAAVLAMSGPFTAKAEESGCTALTRQFMAALDRGDLPAARALETVIARDAECGNGIVPLRRKRVDRQIEMAEALKGAAGREAEREALLTAAAEAQVSWIAAYALGELRMQQHHYAEAAQLFEGAIEIVKDLNKTPVPPKPADTAYLIARAREAGMLAANEKSLGTRARFVPAAPDSRDSAVGGSLSLEVRGVTVKTVPLPINFETDSARLTAIGTEAAKELAEAIKQQNPPSVSLTGHTDERGSDAYNMDLSRRRCETAASFLRQAGVKAKIETEAKGKREPLPVPDAGERTQEEIWALNRRVEWHR
jgi:outer membrane protein OmpA-like peptidoglycan-associated protein